MKLYVMRHGPAEDLSSTGLDEDRALTEPGRARVRDVAALLVREAEMPLRVLASPLVRAHQTADIVVATSEGAVAAGTELALDLAPGGGAKNELFVRSLAAASTASDVGVMVVGHEPDLSSLVERLLGAPSPMLMDKAMVVALELGAEGPGALRFLVDPRGPRIAHDRRG